MFNRNKVNYLERERNRLQTYIDYERSWRKKAEEDGKKQKEEVDRLRFLCFRVVKYLSPVVIGIGGVDVWLRDYLNTIDRDAKECAEREKIEQIVLDLKNRKWEPAE